MEGNITCQFEKQILNKFYDGNYTMPGFYSAVINETLFGEASFINQEFLVSSISNELQLPVEDTKSISKLINKVGHFNPDKFMIQNPQMVKIWLPTFLEDTECKSIRMDQEILEGKEEIFNKGWGCTMCDGAEMPTLKILGPKDHNGQDPTVENLKNSDSHILRTCKKEVQGLKNSCEDRNCALCDSNNACIMCKNDHMLN